jgi:hypothetical protein
MRSFLVSLLLTLAACSGGGSIEPSSANVTPSVAPGVLEAGRMWVGSSGYTTPVRLVIRTPEAWAAAWATLWERGSPVPALPAVDFGREYVVVAAMGQRLSGGYAIHVTDVATPSADAAVVTVVESSPGPACAVAGALSEPAALAILPGSPSQVTFVESAVVAACR